MVGGGACVLGRAGVFVGPDKFAVCPRVWHTAKIRYFMLSFLTKPSRVKLKFTEYTLNILKI